jgi:hypothetical protein
MEFEFTCFDLFEAVRVLKAQPVVKVRDGGLVEKAVGSKLQWIEDNTRANMQKGLNLVAELGDVVLLSVTVRYRPHPTR